MLSSDYFMNQDPDQEVFFGISSSYLFDTVYNPYTDASLSITYLDLTASDYISLSVPNILSINANVVS